MTILYFHQYFKTPNEPGGTRSYWIARELVNSGHHVTMVTTNPKAIQRREEVVIDGIKVIYLKEAYRQDMTIFARLKAFLGFVWKSMIEARRHGKVDLVFATSTPLTIGIVALYMKWFKKTPYIFEVRDLWPEVPIQMGALKNRTLQRLARWFEKTIYQNAEHVIALSPGMQDGVAKYIPRERTTMIPNMAKIDKFWPREKNHHLMRELGLSRDTIKVIHFGALGIANGAEYIVHAAKLLREDKEIEFIFIGGGSTESRLMETVNELGLSNVHFLGAFPMSETSEIVNFSDISIVSFSDIPILSTNSPNKLFDSLSAGKPIIVNSAGWTKQLVEDYSCGFYVNPKDPQDLVDKLLDIKSKKDLLLLMGGKSRWLAENMYDKSLLCKQVVALIEKLDV